MARKLLGRSDDFRKRSLYGDYGRSYYYLLAKANYPSEWHVGAMAVVFSLIGDTISALDNLSPSPRAKMSAGWHVFDMTWWTQSTIAKYHWNKSEFGYTLNTRQMSAYGGNSGRPKDFQSGPGAFLLNMFLK